MWNYYIGGKEKNKHAKNKSRDIFGNYIDNKLPVVGMISRTTGEVRAFVVKAVNKAMVFDKILPKIKPNSTIYTDAAHIYNEIGDYDYTHKSVSHNTNQYVEADNHTNTIEGFCSLLKRGYIGTYHHMSIKHLQRYIDEFAFRYSYSGESAEAKLYSILSLCRQRLTYKELIAK